MKDSEATERTQKFFQKYAKKTRRYALTISFLLVIGTGIWLGFQHSDQSVTSKLSGLGINLLASGFFAVIFTFLSDRERELSRKDELDLKFSALSENMREEWRKSFDQYMPVSVYLPTEEFDLEFNLRIMSHLEQSKQWLFRGISGKHVAVRLEALRKPPSEVTVILPDPNFERANQRRISDLSRSPKFAKATADQIRSEIIGDLEKSVVALFDARRFATLRLAFSVETFVTRTEVTDSSVFISLYRSAQFRTQKHAATTEFSWNSYMYHMERLDCERRDQIANLKATFVYSSTESDLIDLLENISGRKVDAEEVSRLRIEQDREMQSFKTFLAKLRYQANS